MRRLLALRPRQPRPPPRRALAEQGNKGPPRPRRSPLYGESYRRQRSRWSHQNPSPGVYMVRFALICVYGVVAVYITDVGYDIAREIETTDNPHTGGDWRDRFTDDELEELGRMGVNVDGTYARYGGPTKEQRQAILAAQRLRGCGSASTLAGCPMTTSGSSSDSGRSAAPATSTRRSAS